MHQFVEWIQCWLFTSLTKSILSPLWAKLKTVSLRKFDRHRCLADNAVVNLKPVPRNFKGTCCTSKKRQTQNVESVLRLPKKAKTTLKLLSEEGPFSVYQLCYSVPTICIKRIWTESLTRKWKILIDEH